MRTSVTTLLESLPTNPNVVPARAALEEFFLPRVAELELALREGAARPITARTRLALEEVIGKSASELEAARELLQLLYDALFGASVHLDPREFVREAFSVPLSARSEGRAMISAMLSSDDASREIDVNPKVAIVLVARGVELCAARPGRETPHVVIANDESGACCVKVTRRTRATGEPLVLASAGVIAPTVPCLKAAAELTGGTLDWDVASEAFTLRFPLAESASLAQSAT